MVRSSSSHTKKRLDFWAVLLYALLVIFGWMNLYAANYNPETRIAFTPDAEYFKQLVWIGVTLVTAVIIMLSDSKIFVEFSYFIYGGSVLLLLLVLLVGKEVNGAKAWLALGPVQFQPVEFMKIGAALVVSRILSRYGFTFNKKNYLSLFGAIFIPIILVLLQNDTGSALIFLVMLLPMFREGMSPHILLMGFACAVTAIAALLADNVWVMSIILGLGTLVAAVMLIMNGAKRDAGWLVMVTIVAVGVLIGLSYGFGLEQLKGEYIVVIGGAVLTIFVIYKAIAKRIARLWMVLLYLWVELAVAFGTGYIFNNVLIAHQRTRINILFGIEEDPLGAGYNVNQSLIAIGSGGFSGKGYLEGTQTKLNFVPKQTTDFIFCTVGEEWGFLGSIALVALYIAFFWRIIALAEKQHSVFSRAYGYCVACIFFFHFTVNICMTIGLLPVIGIPLPFFSYGGSSLWGFSVLLFLFLKLDTDREELIR